MTSTLDELKFQNTISLVMYLSTQIQNGLQNKQINLTIEMANK